MRQTLQHACDRGDEIYILGDLVEVWIGDDDDSVFAERLKNDLRQIASLTPVFVMAGNRDFLYRDAFTQDTGTTLLPDPFRLSAPDLPFPALLAHGDAYCTSDTAYMNMRRLFRSPTWQDEFLNSSLDERRQFAQAIRSQSKAANQLKAANITDVIESEIQADLATHDCPLMIHGHTHRPAIHNMTDGMKRIVLGDWDRCGWYLRQHEATFELERFAI